MHALFCFCPLDWGQELSFLVCQPKSVLLLIGYSIQLWWSRWRELCGGGLKVEAVASESRSPSCGAGFVLAHYSFLFLMYHIG